MAKSIWPNATTMAFVNAVLVRRDAISASWLYATHLAISTSLDHAIPAYLVYGVLCRTRAGRSHSFAPTIRIQQILSLQLQLDTLSNRSRNCVRRFLVLDLPWWIVWIVEVTAHTRRNVENFQGMLYDPGGVRLPKTTGVCLAEKKLLSRTNPNSIRLSLPFPSRGIIVAVETTTIA